MQTTRKTAKPRRVTRRPKAVTTEVLGDIDRNVAVNPKWQRYYHRLTELRDHLRNRKGELVKDAKEDQPNFSLHMADAGTDEYDRNFALSMISSEQNALYEIEHALNRIKTGTYGICEVTGKRIEPERLNAIPWTRFSAQAERELEKDQAVARTQLGGRERVPKTSATKESSDEEDEE
jgi:RNA polymerase-binding transcription factor DksA